MNIFIRINILTNIEKSDIIRHAESTTAYTTYYNYWRVDNYTLMSSYNGSWRKQFWHTRMKNL